MKRSFFFAAKAIAIAVMALILNACGGSSDRGSGGGSAPITNVVPSPINLIFSGCTQPGNYDQLRIGAPVTCRVTAYNLTSEAIAITFIHDLNQGSNMNPNSEGTVLDELGIEVKQAADSNGGSSGGSSGQLGVEIPPGEGRIIEFDEYTGDLLVGEDSKLTFTITDQDDLTRFLSKNMVFGERPEEHYLRYMEIGQDIYPYFDYWRFPFTWNNELFQAGDQIMEVEQWMNWPNTTYVRGPSDDGIKEVDHYLYLNDSDEGWFEWRAWDDGIKFDGLDPNGVDILVGSVMHVVGKTYMVTDAESIPYTKDGQTRYELSKLKLINNDPLDLSIMKVEKVITNGVVHEVMLVATAQNPDQAEISVDGDVVWLNIDQAVFVNGVLVHLWSLSMSDPENGFFDQAALYVGGTEIILSDHEEIRINGRDIDGTDVFLSAWNENFMGWGFTWELEDDEYLRCGDFLRDPLGLTEVRVLDRIPSADQYEKMVAQSGSNRAEFEFMDDTGMNWEIPVVLGYDNALHFGHDWDDDSCDGRWLLPDQVCTATSYPEMEGVEIPISNSGWFNVLKITNIEDLGPGVLVDFKDGTGYTWNDIFFPKNISAVWCYQPPYVDKGTQCFEINITSDYKIWVDNTGDGTYTQNNALVQLTDTTSIMVGENEWTCDKITGLCSEAFLEVTFTYDILNDEILVGTGIPFGMTWYQESILKPWLKTATTHYGTEVTKDSDNLDWLEILFPRWQPEMVIGYGNPGFTADPSEWLPDEVEESVEEATEEIILP